MKHILTLFLLAQVVACAPINTEFSCKKTATDNCMTIEDVHKMTEYMNA